jgi:predicted amidohydrolase
VLRPSEVCREDIEEEPGRRAGLFRGCIAQAIIGNPSSRRYPHKPDRVGCRTPKRIGIAAAQTPEFRENVAAALDHAIGVAALAEADGVALLAFPECFLQGYLTDGPSARRVALDLSSAEFAAILDRLPKSGPMLVMGLIEVDNGHLFNTAVVIGCGFLLGRYRKAHLLRGEKLLDDPPAGLFDDGMTARGKLREQRRFSAAGTP